VATNGEASDVYARMGVKKLINAQSWVTGLGGSLMRREVFSAMEEAGRYFVDMEELHDAAGRVVARACGAEAGMVTAGAAAGNMLMSAAVMTETDDVRIERLPDTSGMKNEILIFKAQRNHYDKMFEVPGARLVEVGMPNVARRYHLEAGLGEKTAAVAYIFAPFLKQPLTLRETSEIAHARGIPVLVDASAMVPPIENLTRFVREGADMVTFSGGKGIAGPQNSGLLAGKTELIRAARKNYMNPASARASVVRAAKVSKETIVGLVTAIELFLDSDHSAIWNDWRVRAEYIVDRIRGIPGIRAVVEEEPNRQGPQPVIYFEASWKGPSPESVRKLLREGTPPIHVGRGGYRDEINVVMVNVQKGEEKIIAEALDRILRGSQDSNRPSKA